MINLICEVLVVIAIYLLFKEYLVTLKGCKLHLTRRKGPFKFAVLIPARDESLVIEGLLDSLENQTVKVDNADIYIIVESDKDKTVSIAKKRGMNIVYRKDLTKRRKGYALDDAIKEILLANKHYDAYFIFDADNVIDKNFIKEMMKSYQKGYDIGIGYRNTKNGNSSVCAAASSLTFSMINTLGNDYKGKHNLSLTVSGTGFYIAGDILEKLGGYPFNSLTEDYEFSLYAVINNLSSVYNKKAKYFDEQPVNYKVSVMQRTRWVKGYFETRAKYYEKLFVATKSKGDNYASCYTTLVGVMPYILLVISVLLYTLNLIYRIITNLIVSFLVFPLVWQLLLIILFIYIGLVLFTLLLLIKEKNSLKLNRKIKIKVLFYNPFFLISYVKCLYLAIKNKNLSWERIVHNSKME